MDAVTRSSIGQSTNKVGCRCYSNNNQSVIGQVRHSVAISISIGLFKVPVDLRNISVHYHCASCASSVVDGGANCQDNHLIDNAINMLCQLSLLPPPNKVLVHIFLRLHLTTMMMNEWMNANNLLLLHPNSYL